MYEKMSQRKEFTRGTLTQEIENLTRAFDITSDHYRLLTCMASIVKSRLLDDEVFCNSLCRCLFERCIFQDAATPNSVGQVVSLLHMRPVPDRGEVPPPMPRIPVCLGLMEALNEYVGRVQDCMRCDPMSGSSFLAKTMIMLSEIGIRASYQDYDVLHVASLGHLINLIRMYLGLGINMPPEYDQTMRQTILDVLQYSIAYTTIPLGLKPAFDHVYQAFPGQLNYQLYQNPNSTSSMQMNQLADQFVTQSISGPSDEEVDDAYEKFLRETGQSNGYIDSGAPQTPDANIDHSQFDDDIDKEYSKYLDEFEDKPVDILGGY